MSQRIGRRRFLHGAAAAALHGLPWAGFLDPPAPTANHVHCVSGGVPRDIAERIDARLWEEDWRVMSLPGRLQMHRALVLDYRSHVARFGDAFVTSVEARACPTSR
jgi:hypothetical protein